MKKTLFQKIINLALFLSSSCSMSCLAVGCNFDNRNLAHHEYRFYIHYSKFKLPDDYVIEMQYFENNSTISKEFQRTKNSNLFYVDIPSNLEAIYLNIIKPDYGYYLKDYPVRKIYYDVIYECDDNTYRFDNIKLINTLPLSCRDFADCILCNINPLSDSFSSGFNAYDQINSFFYSSIIDKENSSTTYFYDSELEKEVTVETRMNELQQRSVATHKKNGFLPLFIYFLSLAIILVLPLLILMMYFGIKRILIWKRKKC